MEFIKKIIKILIAKIWIFKNVRKLDENQYFFCSIGIGDVLFVLGYLDAYKKTHLINKKSVFIVRESHKQVVKMYSEYVDDIITVKPLIFKALNYYLIRNAKKQRKVFLAHPYSLMYEPTKLLGVKDICLLDFYKVLFEIPFDSKLVSPSVDNKNKNKLIKEYNLQDNKSILLCPYCASISMESFDMTLWDKLANKYLELGYQVYTNIKDDTEKVIENTRPINLNLMDFYSIISEFEHVYSMRSGLCDLMAFSNVGLTIFYPSDNENKSRSYSEFNMKNIGIRDDINEIILTKDCNLRELLKKL